jgi:hypothetical protein
MLLLGSLNDYHFLVNSFVYCIFFFYPWDDNVSLSQEIQCYTNVVTMSMPGDTLFGIFLNITCLMKYQE